MASSDGRGGGVGADGAGAGAGGGGGAGGEGRDRNHWLVFDPLRTPPNLHLQQIGLGFLALNLAMKTQEARAIEKSEASEGNRIEETKAWEPKLDCTYTVQQFFSDKKKNADPMGNGLVRKVFIPARNGRTKAKLKLTDEASGVTTSLVHCVTRELAARRCWDDNLDLNHFSIIDGTVHAIVKPPRKLATSVAIQTNGTWLASILKNNFGFEGLLPVYFENLISLLENIPAGGLEDWRRTGIDTNCGLMTQYGRIVLSVLLKSFEDELNKGDHLHFLVAIDLASFKETWLTDVMDIEQLKKVASYEVNGVKTSYKQGNRKSAFTYIRHHSAHIAGHLKEMGERFDEDAELLIPDVFGDFLADIMNRLLKSRLSKQITKIARICMSCSSLPVDFESKVSTIMEALREPADKDIELPDGELHSLPADAIFFGDMGPGFAPSGPPISILEGKDRAPGGWGGGLDSLLLIRIRRVQLLEEELAKAKERVAKLESDLQMERS